MVAEPVRALRDETLIARAARHNHAPRACEHGHQFESWFANSSAYENQAKKRLIACPVCNSAKVEKTIMAPNLAARLLINKGKQVETVKDSPHSLNSREEEIFAFVARGRSNKEIARALNCTERTVKHHMTKIMQKLNVRNRVQAVLKFREAGASA